MIFIAKNHGGKVIGIVSAKNKESVMAYYQGQGLNYNTIESFDIAEDRGNEQMGYVTPILKTQEIQIDGFTHKGKAIIVV